MKKLLFFALACLILSSCSRYTIAGEGGCYFAKRKFNTYKNVVRIR